MPVKPLLSPGRVIALSRDWPCPHSWGLLGWRGQGCHSVAFHRRGSLVEQKGHVLRGRQYRLCYLVAMWPRTNSLTSLTLRFFIYNTDIWTLILPGLLWGLNEIIYLIWQQHALSEKVTLCSLVRSICCLLHSQLFSKTEIWLLYLKHFSGFPW